MKDLMKYKDYYGSVHYDDQELVLHGKIEFIRALVSYEATTAKKLRQAFEEAVDDYLELCGSKNIEPEVSFKGSLNVRLGAELHRQLAIVADQHNLSINKYITDTLMNAIKEENWHESRKN